MGEGSIYILVRCSVTHGGLYASYGTMLHVTTLFLAADWLPEPRIRY